MKKAVVIIFLCFTLTLAAIHAKPAANEPLGVPQEQPPEGIMNAGDMERILSQNSVCCKLHLACCQLG